MEPEMTSSSGEALKTSKTAVDPDEFLTTRELMRLLKIRHRQTIYELISEGLPTLKVGRNYRFIKREVIEFLRSNSHRKGPLKQP